MIIQDLVTAVEEKLREDRWFTISTFSLALPNFYFTKLSLNIFGFHKLWTRVPKLLTKDKLLTKEQRMNRTACALDYFFGPIPFGRRSTFRENFQRWWDVSFSQNPIVKKSINGMVTPNNATHSQGWEDNFNTQSYSNRLLEHMSMTPEYKSV